MLCAWLRICKISRYLARLSFLATHRTLFCSFSGGRGQTWEWRGEDGEDGPLNRICVGTGHACLFVLTRHGAMQDVITTHQGLPVRSLQRCNDDCGSCRPVMRGFKVDVRMLQCNIVMAMYDHGSEKVRPCKTR